MPQNSLRLGRWIVQSLRLGRWVVVSGAIVGILAFVVVLARGDSVIRALGAALGLDLLTMGVCGVSERFWSGDKVKKMSAARDGY